MADSSCGADARERGGNVLGVGRGGAGVMTMGLVVGLGMGLLGTVVAHADSNMAANTGAA
jgi:hypothetical protein